MFNGPQLGIYIQAKRPTRRKEVFALLARGFLLKQNNSHQADSTAVRRGNIRRRSTGAIWRLILKRTLQRLIAATSANDPLEPLGALGGNGLRQRFIAATSANDPMEPFGAVRHRYPMCLWLIF